MAEPQTPNTGLIVPNTGDLVGTWGSAALNPNLTVVDSYQGGLVAIAASGSITLTAPAGFTATPSAGPTQSQNALIRLSGALSANAQIAFPLPGYYIIENLCTNISTYYVQLLSTPTGNMIGAIPGKKCHVFNDGTNMDYVNMPDSGTAYDLHGWTTYPPWMLACTILPYLIKDGSQHATSAYPNLFANIGYTYGGSGANFNVPDERARMRIAYDPGNTGRVNSTVNAGTMGSAGGAQALNSANQVPQITFTPAGSIGGSQSFTSVVRSGSPYSGIGGWSSGSDGGISTLTVSGNGFSFSGSSVSIGSASPIQALPPAIVSCLAMIKT